MGSMHGHITGVRIAGSDEDGAIPLEKRNSAGSQKNAGAGKVLLR